MSTDGRIGVAAALLDGHDARWRRKDMDEDLATILHWWDSLSDLERGTASWVVEALAARHQGLPTFPTDLSVDQVVAFIAVAASHGWHCDCCRWSQDSE